MKKIPAEKAATELPKTWERFVDDVRSQSRLAMERIGRHVLDSAIPKTPKDTGALRASGRFEVDKEENGISAVVSYGGENYRVTPTANAPRGIVDYAVKVHENLEGHDYAIGGPKFLEQAADQTRRTQGDILINMLKKVGK